QSVLQPRSERRRSGVGAVSERCRSDIEAALERCQSRGLPRRTRRSSVSPMNRRSFLTLGAAGAIGVLRSARNVRAQATQPDIPFGESRLGVSDDGRDGTLYLPKKYKAGTPLPALMMLHGFGGTGTGVRYTF